MLEQRMKETDNFRLNNSPKNSNNSALKDNNELDGERQN